MLIRSGKKMLSLEFYYQHKWQPILWQCSYIMKVAQQAQNINQSKVSEYGAYNYTCMPSNMLKTSEAGVLYNMHLTLWKWLLGMLCIKCLHSKDFLILIMQKSYQKKALSPASLFISPKWKHSFFLWNT